MSFMDPPVDDPSIDVIDEESMKLVIGTVVSGLPTATSAAAAVKFQANPSSP